MFISGAVGMSERNGSLGDQEPDMRLSVMPCPLRADVNAEVSSGVISKSPLSSGPARGLGDSEEKGDAVSDSVLAHVSRRFGRVTSRSTEAL